ncbi:MAG: helix-turn-helix transcriptional regulator [Clostridia bacterium]|nr:helix-turn-helix transcriptional regulator [Clostridia bacterium]
MEKNICRFISTRNPRQEINILHFVYEKQAQFRQEYIIPSTYSVAFVTSGEGKLYTHAGVYGLSEGDVFLTFPSTPYYIENSGKINYIYITFIGARAPVLMDRLCISRSVPVFHGLDRLRPIWEDAIESVTEENIDLLCEGVLLYSLSNICLQKDEPAAKTRENVILKVKKYIDDHFTDCNLNLASVGKKFAYNPKYLSTAFKKMVMVSFTEYLTDRRLEYAASLINGGIENVRELSELCGYRDPLYFSKAFKKKYGVSPKNYMKPGESRT